MYVPVAKPDKFCVVAPLLHEYVRGGYPPVTDVVIAPSLPEDADADKEIDIATKGSFPVRVTTLLLEAATAVLLESKAMAWPLVIPATTVQETVVLLTFQ